MNISQFEIGILTEAVATRPETAPVHYATLDGLAALVEAVRLRSVIKEKFDRPDFEADYPYDNLHILPREVVMIHLVLVDHYLAQHGFDVDEYDLRALYLPYEKYLLQSKGNSRLTPPRTRIVQLWSSTNIGGRYSTRQNSAIETQK